MKSIKDKHFTIYLMYGIPGSGKSTYIKEHLKGLPIISRDIIRIQLGIAKDNEKIQCSLEEEKKVTEIEYAKIKKFIENKTSFIIDDTNTNKRYRETLIQLLKNNKAYIIGIVLDTPIEICIERRKGQIPESVIKEIDNNKYPLELNECNEIIYVKYNQNKKN